MEDDDEGPKPNRAKIDDEFLKHPQSGGLFRNPLHPSLDRTRSTPVLFQAGEFHHNCLQDALADWHCITISEESLRQLQGGAQAQAASPGGSSTLKTTAALSLGTTSRPVKAKASISKLRELSSGYEFCITLRKLTYVPPRNRRRNQEPKTTNGVTVDKANIEVAPAGASLKIVNMTEGLVMVWNRMKPFLEVRIGDQITSVNGRREPAAMIEEMNTAPDALRIMIRRLPSEHNPEEVIAAAPA